HVTAVEAGATTNFYTRARDNAGNYEDAPTSPPDASTVLDTQSPSSSASAAAYSNSTSLTVSYSASDAGPSGVKEVELWVKRPGDSSYALAATDTTPATAEHTSEPQARGRTVSPHTRAPSHASDSAPTPTTPLALHAALPI